MPHHFLGWQSWVDNILNNSRLVENYSSHLLHQDLAFHLDIEMKCRYLACWFYLIYFFNFSTDILENWCGRITAQIFLSYFRNFIQFWVVIKLYFQTILNSNPEMRTRVERAVIENAEKQKLQSTAASSRSHQPSQPSIKLKMDFSNFK